MLVACLGFTVVNAQEKVLDADTEKKTELVEGAKIVFDETEHDFGDQAQGVPVTHEFTFKNEGTEPLVLENVKASCGCTTPFWPKEPILPGQEAKISAKYNMAKGGSFRKSITVTTKGKIEGEAGERVVLYIKGNAVAAEKDSSVEEAKPTLITNPKVK